MIITLNGCARCLGEGHKALVFHAFTLNQIEDSNGNFTHWAMCPVVNEPILMRVTPEGGDAENG